MFACGQPHSCNHAYDLMSVKSCGVIKALRGQLHAPALLSKCVTGQCIAFPPPPREMQTGTWKIGVSAVGGLFTVVLIATLAYLLWKRIRPSKVSPFHVSNSMSPPHSMQCCCKAGSGLFNRYCAYVSPLSCCLCHHSSSMRLFLPLFASLSQGKLL